LRAFSGTALATSSPEAGGLKQWFGKPGFAFVPAFSSIDQTVGPPMTLRVWWHGRTALLFCLRNWNLNWRYCSQESGESDGNKRSRHHWSNSETASLLQSAYSDYQIGPLENLHQPVKNTPLVVLGAGLKVYFQYSLRLADRLKSQLLISHCFFPLKRADRWSG
jgi:hypothetical protein